MTEAATKHRLTWRRATVGGRTACYGVAGSGAPLVFLHGWGLGYRSYGASLTRLAAGGMRVYAPALPGFGGTADLRATDVSMGGYASWVSEFVRAAEVPTPFVLVGHSFGGGVAIQVTHDNEDLVSQLIVVNSIGGSAWTSSKGVVRTMVERPIWDWGLHLQADLLPLRQARRVLPVVTADALSNVLRSPRALFRIGRLAAGANLVGELEELKRRGVPVVILWGTEDKVIPAACLESMRAALGGVDVVTVAGNHSWLLADPRGFAEVITNVIGVVPGGVEQDRPRRRRRAPATDAQRTA